MAHFIDHKSTSDRPLTFEILWNLPQLSFFRHLQSLCRDQGDITTRRFYENKCLSGPGTWGSILVIYSVNGSGL